MTQVLIIDESSLFREYLSSILEQTGNFKVQAALNGFDGIVKLKNDPPDLIIMSMYLSRDGTREVLAQKKTAPNLVDIPVILLTNKLDAQQTEEFALYRVDKILLKPLKLGLLYHFLNKEFKILLFHDDTVGAIKITVNDSIIFIRVTVALNLNDLDALNFKLKETIELFDLTVIKIIIIMNDIQMTFSEAVNLVRFFQIITAINGIKYQNIKVLSNIAFIQKFLQLNPEVLGISIITTLKGAILMLIDMTDKPVHNKRSNFEIAYSVGINALTEATKNITIAVVSHVPALIETLNGIFQPACVLIKTYATVNEYTNDAQRNLFDVTFLDTEIPTLNLFEELAAFEKRDIKHHIVLMISTKQRELAWNSFEQGITRYVVKPLKSAEVFRQFIQIVYRNF
ncbi:MAG: response regulator [Spirochaetaceae bacterium]|jgi:CheY-like chemotaxis protein|nr:response regulator [Spirochaetaceae bacterium]